MAVPYARREQVGNQWFAICPVCNERIELFHMKDFESHSAIEYARHYQRQHKEAHESDHRGNPERQAGNGD